VERLTWGLGGTPIYTHLGIAAGASTAFFGLSPFFLSFVASAFFSTKDGELDIGRFLTVLAIGAGVAHLVAASFLRVFPTKTGAVHEPEEEIENPVPVLHATEETPLLARPGKPLLSPQPIGQLLRDADFWLLALSMLLLLGSVSSLLEPWSKKFHFAL